MSNLSDISSNAHLIHSLFSASGQLLLLISKNLDLLESNPAARQHFPSLQTNSLPLSLSNIPELQALAPILQAYFSHPGQDRRELGSFLPDAEEGRGYDVWVCLHQDDQLLLELRPCLNKKSSWPLYELFGNILNNLPSPVAAVDTSLNLLYHNRAFQREVKQIFGREVSVGQNISELLRSLPQDKQTASFLFEKALQGEAFTVVESFGNENINRQTYEISFNALHDSTGTLRGALLLAKNISAELKAQRRLRHSETHYRTLVENLPDIIVRCDPNMRILLVNPAAQQLTGLAALEGETLTEIPFARQISEEFFRKFRQAIVERSEQHYIRMNSEGEKEVELHTRILPEFNEEGQVESLLIVIRDVSELRKAKNLLRNAQEFYFLTESLPQLVWVTEADGMLNFVNSQWVNYSGQQKEEAMGWGWLDIVHPNDLQKTREVWKNALETRKPYQIEYRLRHKNGQYRWFLGRAKPMLDEGKIVKWFGTCTDIHNQKQNRAYLQQKVLEFQLLNEVIPQIVWSSQADGELDYFNQRWYEYTGLSYEDSKEKGWSLIVHPAEYERTQSIWQHALKTGTSFNIEFRLQRYDGVYRWFINRALPLRDAQGNITKWFGTCTDIEDERDQREQLVTKNRALEHMNRYLDEFVHTVAHDLRSPVASLKLSFELLQKEQNPEKREQVINLFPSLIQRIDNTLIGLVEIIQMQEEQHSLKARPQNVKAVSQDVIQNLDLSSQRAVPEISLDFPEQEKSLNYPSSYLQSMLRKLLGVMSKNPREGVPLHIRIKGHWRGEAYLLQLSDNGQGIDLNRHGKNLFKPFKRLSREPDNLGVGLHLVKTMVEHNGGSIAVESQPGQGTRYTLELIPYSQGKSVWIQPA